MFAVRWPLVAFHELCTNDYKWCTIQIDSCPTDDPPVILKPHKMCFSICRTYTCGCALKAINDTLAKLSRSKINMHVHNHSGAMDVSFYFTFSFHVISTARVKN